MSRTESEPPISVNFTFWHLELTLYTWAPFVGPKSIRGSPLSECPISVLPVPSVPINNTEIGLSKKYKFFIHLQELISWTNLPNFRFASATISHHKRFKKCLNIQQEMFYHSHMKFRGKTSCTNYVNYAYARKLTTFFSDDSFIRLEIRTNKNI